MAKWLSKYEQGGLVLKKKTKDNYSLKGNANDASVSVGPNFVGEGLINGPKFKNPAWKGQFAMGGALPGSVGFMYARTQNPAPANGKYTKKTLASAQAGIVMPEAELTTNEPRPQLSTAIKSGTENPTTKFATKKEIDKKKKLTEEQYYNPDKPTYKSGNLAIDVLASNPWLMKLPIIGDKIKDQAYALGVQHADARRTDEELANPNKIDEVEGKYTGAFTNDFGEPFDLVKTYIYGNTGKDNIKFPNSPYVPKDDYYDFLPSYSLKERLGHPTNADLNMSNIGKDPTSYKKDGEIIINPDGGAIGPETYKDLMEVVKTHKPKYYNSGIDEKNFKELDYNLFYKQGGPDLAHYKSGFGYDEDVNLPYAFLSDAWDFYPKDYGNFWNQGKKQDPKSTREYQQAYLMHKVGNPFKIYERTYIDPENKTLVSDKEIIDKKLKKKFKPAGLSSKVTEDLQNTVGKSYNPNMQNGGEMAFYQNGLDFKPKSISKNGSVIKDNRGQWAHPGKITEIGSPNITMQGVDYPVLGISDTGHTQMMYPNQDYKFDGNKVTEYPMAQTGISMGVESGTYQPTSKVVTQKDIEAAKIQEMRDKQGSITKAGPRQSALSKSWSILTNPMTALEYKVHHKDLPDHFERGPRNVLDYAVDVVNPYGIADAAASIPGDISRGDIGSAALNTLSVLPALHELGAVGKATKTASQLSKAKNLKEAANYLVQGIPVERSLPRLAEGELKTFRQIQRIPEMRDKGKSLAEQMKYAIESDIPNEHFERIFNKTKDEAQHLLNTGFGERPAVDREALRNRFRQLDQQTPAPPIDSTPSANARENWIRQIDNLSDSGFQPNHDFYEQLGHRTTPTSYDQMTDSEIEALHNHLSGRLDERLRSLSDEFRNMETDRDLYDLSDLDLDTNDFINHYQSQQSPQNNKSVQNIGDKLTKAEIAARDKVNTFVQNATQSYPYYSGNVEEKVQSLFRSQERSLNDVSRKVARQTENIPSGTMWTGSLNTSHNSWLPQIKKTFSYEGGVPQFTGYKPMNSLGYLSKAQVPEEDIIKYLNTEMDDLVKKGRLPNDVQRPIMHKGHPLVPQYAIKQNKNGGWLNKYK